MANLGYLQLTRRCVQSCRFCSNPPTGEELSGAGMRAELDRLARLGYDGVILTGGEPTCSPLLVDAIEHSAGLGLRCRMITNGQLLADRELFARCVGAGLNHIHVSIHSHRPSVHDFLTRNEGSFGAVSRCLALVPELEVACDVNTVINAYNAGNVEPLNSSHSWSPAPPNARAASSVLTSVIFSVPPTATMSLAPEATAK